MKMHLAAPLALALLLSPSLEAAENSSVLPKQLQEVRFEQKVGDSVPLDATFRNELGQTVRLGDYFGKRPVVLSLVYYECPMLCTMVLNGLTATLRTLTYDVGREFEVVTVSFNPKDEFPLAARKKANYVSSYGRAGADAGWHFLTGDEDQIRRLTNAAGFHYAFDEKTGQYAHASGVIVLTPDGRLSRYLYGIDYPARDLKLAVVEAGEGKIGSVVDRALLYCFHYDPSTGRYSATARNLLRAAGGLTILALAGYIFATNRRGRGGRTPADGPSAGAGEGGREN